MVRNRSGDVGTSWPRTIGHRCWASVDFDRTSCRSKRGSQGTVLNQPRILHGRYLACLVTAHSSGRARITLVPCSFSVPPRHSGRLVLGIVRIAAVVYRFSARPLPLRCLPLLMGLGTTGSQDHSEIGESSCQQDRRDPNRSEGRAWILAIGSLHCVGGFRWILSRTFTVQLILSLGQTYIGTTHFPRRGWSSSTSWVTAASRERHPLVVLGIAIATNLFGVGVESLLQVRLCVF